MKLFNFKDGERELGTLLVCDVNAVMITNNYLDVLVCGKMVQILYSTNLRAQEDYCKLTAVWDEEMKKASAFGEMLVSVEGLQ